MKDKYLIYATTNWCWFTQYLVGWFTPFIIVLASGSDINVFKILSLFLLLNVTTWFFVRKFLLQPIEIYFTQERLYLRYLSYDLQKTKKEVSTSLDRITGFSDYTVSQELKFRLYFVNGQKFTLHKNEFWARKDDFQLLIDDFKAHSERLNEDLRVEGNLIPRRKIKYGDNTYLNFSLYILVIVITVLIVLLFSGAIESTFDRWLYGIITAVFLGASGFVRHKQTKKKVNDK
jgi:hypothetical protein